ncbi:hypothetical protein T310_1524 [Rasamsonia emersonii CBS 393.64]|uniref:Uncharacterized protein n=1 Tax=Rasamsonia emersonii (strain ATCC 16479 / CBS 393.64 / IMI 116815) TaxID=1408163 RepID=A0A0F4Z296_RASE3|nr:hypothetical protein T310_1524 [Rasamsonia emersonii CBS 393.64]KKA24495.1 hypothetical protein T310_1524 [Rasamsonia emersonii CBS 393.64]
MSQELLASHRERIFLPLGKASGRHVSKGAKMRQTDGDYGHQDKMPSLSRASVPSQCHEIHICIYMTCSMLPSVFFNLSEIPRMPPVYHQSTRVLDRNKVLSEKRVGASRPNERIDGEWSRSDDRRSDLMNLPFNSSINNKSIIILITSPRRTGIPMPIPTPHLHDSHAAVVQTPARGRNRDFTSAGPMPSDSSESSSRCKPGGYLMSEMGLQRSNQTG